MLLKRPLPDLDIRHLDTRVSVKEDIKIFASFSGWQIKMWDIKSVHVKGKDKFSKSELAFFPSRQNFFASAKSKVSLGFVIPSVDMINPVLSEECF